METTIKLVEKYQCSGCGIGSDTKCGQYKKSKYNESCESHCAGTFTIPGGRIYLGMPKGFNKVGVIDRENKEHNNIRIFNELPEYDKCNVPVWFAVKEGILFVRCFLPRIGRHYIDIVPNGDSSKLYGKPLDISTFEDEID